MPEYLSPGVYVEEVDSGPKPIEGVGTAMAAFVGFTEKAEELNKPVLITSWSQFVERFGGFVPGFYLPHSVYGYFNNGGTRCYIVSVATIPRAEVVLKTDDQDQVDALKVIARQAGDRGDKLRVTVESAGPPYTFIVEKETSPEVYATFEEIKDVILPTGVVTGTETLKDSKGNALAPGKVDLGLNTGITGKLQVDPKSQSLVDGARKPALKVEPKDKSITENLRVRVSPSGLPFTFTVEKRIKESEWEMVEKIRDVSVKKKPVGGKEQLVLEYSSDKMPKYVVLELQGDILETKTLKAIEPGTELTVSEQIPRVSDDKITGEVAERTGVEGLEVLDDVTMLVVPDLMTATDANGDPKLDVIRSVQAKMIAHCQRLGDRVAILDVPRKDATRGMTPQEVKTWKVDTAGFDSSYAAMYYPWIKVMDPATGKVIEVPPSGHIAGLWAHNDNTRGVHKAPANEVLQGVVGLAYNMTKGEQDTLNPNGINCIRAFPGRGIRVWGARTLSSDPAWRYINVRRLFNYVEKSIDHGTQWVVFEPNDRKLWARVTRDVSAFLRTVWRDGALFGSSPEEAFYVKCDDATNPPESRDLGRLIIEIGLAPVKPAEFVIFRISQWAGPGTE